jgi:5'(3')-deoxyribonucleotidase
MFDVQAIRERLQRKHPLTPLYVDVDSVIINIKDEWARRLPIAGITGESFTQWDVHTQFSLSFDDAYGPLSDRDFYDDMPPIANAREGIEALRRVGYDVVFASSCVANGYEQKLNWLDREGFLATPLSNRSSQRDFVGISRKAMLEGDVLIDDRADTFLHWRRIGRLPILFDQSHNQEVDTPYRADWETIIEAVGG